MRRKGIVTSPDQTICLCMIVKDEAAVIARCLASVRPFVDCFVVVDTGSTDDTMAIAWTSLAGLPGMLVSRPWVDFGHNRTEALALARSQAAYSLIIDAREEMPDPDGWTWPTLTADSYLLEVRDGARIARATRLVSNAFAWRYVGVLYEFLNCADARRADELPIVLRRHDDGRRRRDATTYRDDAAVLATALATESDPYLAARYAFYLAQSYRDAGDHAAALDAYLHRATLGLWEQEVYVSLCEAARRMEVLGRDPDIILATYRRATELCPTRAEAAHGASRLCRFRGRHAEGYAIAKPAITLAMPTAGLAIEPWIYRHGMLDEFAVNAYWSGHHHDCLAACRRLLALDDLSEDDRARFAGNAKFAEERIAESEVASVTPRAPPAIRSEPGLDDLGHRLGAVLESVNLCVNAFDPATHDARPLVLRMEDDIERPSVQWLGARDLVARVDRFVFASAWQMARFVEHFGLRTDRCVVLRPATDVPAFDRPWTNRFPFNVTYLGGPDDGLSVLLDALDQLGPIGVEAHVWLSGHDEDVDATRALRQRARGLANVEWHDADVSLDRRRAALRGCDFFVCPNPRAEASCLAAIEAMAHGCRVIGPAHGALPELVGRFGRTYPFTARQDDHAARFAAVLREEIRTPWQGRPSLSVEQQRSVRAEHDWPVRIGEWQALLDRLAKDHFGVVGGTRPHDRGRTIETLVRLRDRGFVPDGIIDAGAKDGAFARAARRIFRQAHLLLIDASPEREAGLAIVSRDIGEASHVIAHLGTRAARRLPFRRRATRDAAPRSTLARLVSASGRTFQMLKLDVGGGELDVLAGLGSHLGTIEVILIAMSLVADTPGMPLLDAVVARLGAIGFVLCDIVEERRFREGSLLRVEGLFVRPRSRFRPHLSPQ